jgi:aspartate-semialdehyde dehydrogenase
MIRKMSVGILGCTGTVGQKLISLLTNHPWFKITEVVASNKSADKIYGDYVNWRETAPLDSNISSMKIKKCFDNLESKLLFSGLDSSVAGEVETYYAKNGHIVVSNSKNHRMDKTVPLIIPEINSDHIRLITQQQTGNIKNIKSSGYIVTNPNCSTIIIAIAVFSIFKYFGIKNIGVTTMQAISGAGYPGIPSLDILGNVIPYIKDEEEKIQSELLKIFGKYQGGKIIPAKINISASCNRVPVFNGHTLAISLTTKNKATKEEIIDSFANIKWIDLPSSPKHIIKYLDNAVRPQPLLDVNIGNGMTVSVGNLRPCNVLDWKLTAFGHNTIRGAAGAAILNAEYIVARNLC